MLPPNARVTRSMVVGKNLLIVTFPNFNRTLHHKIKSLRAFTPEGVLTSLLMVKAFLRLC